MLVQAEHGGDKVSNFIEDLSYKQVRSGIKAFYDLYGFRLSENYCNAPVKDRELYDLLVTEKLHRDAQSEQEERWVSYSKRYNELVYGDS